MRQGSILVEGSVDGFQALGAFGQPVHQSYVQLRAAIERQLGPRYANFFARPQIDDRAKWIRWVAPVPGQAVSWRDLSREQQAERALDLQIMRGGFDRYMKELAAGRGNARGHNGGEAFGAVLTQALKTPNDGHLHFIGDQPIATFWGFTEPGSPGFEPLAAVPAADAALGMPATPAAATVLDPVAPTPVEERRRRWPWWLVPLALLLLLLLLYLFRPAAPRLVGLPPLLTEPPLVVAPEEPLVEGDLAPERRVIEGDGGVVIDREGVIVPDGGAGLEGGVVEEPPADAEPAAPLEPVAPETGIEDTPPEGAEAPPVEPPAPDAPEPGPTPDPAAPEPPDPAGAEDPAPETPPEAPPGPEDAQQDPAAAGPDPGAAPGAGGALAIPESAAGGSGPADFLQGRWRSRSGLVDEATGGELDQSYEFDQAGRGRSVVRRADGVECSAPAEARMQNGQLQVQELGNLRCADGQEFEGTETVCERDAAGRTSCRGAYSGGQGFEVQIDRAEP